MSEGSFRGDRFFLSYFYEAALEYGGIRYGSSEAAYQAQKCASEEDRRLFSRLSPAEAKELGGQLEPRPGRDSEKAAVMADIIRKKFRQHSDLAARLLATGDEYLEERNSWEDRFWGTDMGGQGQNVPGTILMAVRDDLRAEASGTGKKPAPGGLRGCRHREVGSRFQNTFKVYSKYMEPHTLQAILINCPFPVAFRPFPFQDSGFAQRRDDFSHRGASQSGKFRYFVKREIRMRFNSFEDESLVLFERWQRAIPVSGRASFPGEGQRDFDAAPGEFVCRLPVCSCNHRDTVAGVFAESD